MKNTILITLILFTQLANNHAQVASGDPHIERFMEDAPKDPAYTKFKTRLNAMLAQAKGSNTNAGAIKLLYVENRSLLQSLHRKSGLSESRMMPLSAKPPVEAMLAKPGVMISGSPKYKAAGTLATKLPPYEATWQRAMFNNANMPLPFDTTASVFGQGKIAITSTPCSSQNFCRLGLYSLGYTEKIKVPANPKILAAQVKFSYAFNYTAWDSYGAKSAIYLVMRTLENFHSTAFQQLPEPPVNFGFKYPNDRWKQFGVLMPLDTITTDFGELHATADASWSVEGYVTPGSELEFMVGFVFPQGTNKGLTGCYHYGEFRLKKIDVSYYTSVTP